MTRSFDVSCMLGVLRTSKYSPKWAAVKEIFRYFAKKMRTNGSRRLLRCAFLEHTRKRERILKVGKQGVSFAILLGPEKDRFLLLRSSPMA